MGRTNKESKRRGRIDERAGEKEYNSWDEVESEVEEEVEGVDGDEDFMNARVDVRRFFNEDASVGTGSDAASSRNEEESVGQDEQYKKRKILLGRERERKWVSQGNKTLKTCRHFAYSLIERAWEFQWEAHQVADLIALTIDELGLDSAGTLHALLKTQSADVETISCLVDKGMNFNAVEILSVLQQSAYDAIKFCKSVGEALDQGLLSLRDSATLEAICKLPAEKNFSFSEVSCLVSALVEHSPSKTLYGQCFALATEHLPPQDIALLGIKIVSSHVFREMKGPMNTFLNSLTVGRTELEALINNKFHRDSGGEIMESDEDSEGNLKDFVVDDDVVFMDTSAEEDGSEDEDDFIDDEEEDDESVKLNGDLGDNIHFYRKVDMARRKAVREDDGLWNTQETPENRKKKLQAYRKQKSQKIKKTISRTKENTEKKVLRKGGKKRFDLDSDDEEVIQSNSKGQTSAVHVDNSLAYKAKNTTAETIANEVISLISPPNSLSKDRSKFKTQNGNGAIDSSSEKEPAKDSRPLKTTTGTKNDKRPRNGNRSKLHFDESEEEEFGSLRQSNRNDGESDSSVSSQSSVVPARKKACRDLTALFPSLPDSSQDIMEAIPRSTIGVSRKPVEDVLDFSFEGSSSPTNNTSKHKEQQLSRTSNHKTDSAKKKSFSSSSHKKMTVEFTRKISEVEEVDDDVIDSSSIKDHARKEAKSRQSNHHRSPHNSKAVTEYYDF